MRLAMARFPWMAWALPGLLGISLGVTGCSSYKIQFKVEDVINDAGKGDANREQLDVDIVTVTAADAKEFPELVDGAWRSKDWFTARDKGDARIRKLEARKHVYALCNSKSDEVIRLHASLASGMDTNEKVVAITLPRPGWFQPGWDSFVVFGRFQDREGGVSDARPVIIRPADDAVISVGRTSIVRLDTRK